MPSTYSSLKIELIGTGEQSGIWGTTTNVNLGTAIEEAITGSADVTFASGSVTLTLTDTNGSQAARNLRLNLIGTSGGAQNLIVPAIEKFYLINNGCADAITVKNSTGTGVAVPAGRALLVYNNGTNVVEALTYLTAPTLGTATFTSGPVISSATASKVVFTGTGKELTTTGTVGLDQGGTNATTAIQAVINLGILTSATGSAILPLGTTAEQDVSPQAGFFRFNTTLTRFEGYNGTTWNPTSIITSLTGSEIVPAGTLAQRDGSPQTGFFRFNTTYGQFEGYNGTAWGQVGGGATGGGGDQVFVENNQTVTTTYAIPAGKSASSTGPITVNSGVTVTVPSGSRWVIL
jgi:hypothetical protein